MSQKRAMSRQGRMNGLMKLKPWGTRAWFYAEKRLTVCAPFYASPKKWARYRRWVDEWVRLLEERDDTLRD